MLAYRFPILGALWIVAGIVVAAIYDYFDSLDAAGEILTLIAAILMWPMLLFGFEIRIRR